MAHAPYLREKARQMASDGLLADLESRGHRFRTDGDAETIVHLYEDHGADFVEKLDGMFAVGLWDARTRRLILARDRAGKKPLFYYRDAQRLVFGSEIKAILAHPGVRTSLREAEIPSTTISWVRRGSRRTTTSSGWTPASSLAARFRTSRSSTRRRYDWLRCATLNPTLSIDAHGTDDIRLAADPRLSA